MPREFQLHHSETYRYALALDRFYYVIDFIFVLQKFPIRSLHALCCECIATVGQPYLEQRSSRPRQVESNTTGVGATVRGKLDLCERKEIFKCYVSAAVMMCVGTILIQWSLEF
jgi:hypothetical protein